MFKNFSQPRIILSSDVSHNSGSLPLYEIVCGHEFMHICICVHVMCTDTCADRCVGKYMLVYLHRQQWLQCRRRQGKCRVAADLTSQQFIFDTSDRLDTCMRSQNGDAKRTKLTMILNPKLTFCVVVVSSASHGMHLPVLVFTGLVFRQV